MFAVDWTHSCSIEQNARGLVPADRCPGSGEVRVTGLVDTGRVGRADRCTDSALMNRSLRSGELNRQYGNELADHYLTRCGHDAADEDKLGCTPWSTSSSELRCLWSDVLGPYNDGYRRRGG